MLDFGEYIIIVAVVGLVLGVAAPRLLGTRTPVGLVDGALLGIAGAVLGGLVGWYAVHSRIVGFVLAAAVTLSLVYSMRTISSSK